MNILEYDYNGFKYYKYKGVYFYIDSALADHAEDIKNGFSAYVNIVQNRPVYLYRDLITGELEHSIARRDDCRLKTYIDDIPVMYREPDIDFKDADVRGYVRMCWSEKRNYNVICFMRNVASGSGYSVHDTYTLGDLFSHIDMNRKCS
jgi:hypothetical protein